MNDSDAAFTGTIPEHYDEFLGPAIFEEYGLDLVRRLSLSSHATVLEIAAGTGIVTKHLRSTLPNDVEIIATDLNYSMLDFAQRKFHSAENLIFKQADAQELIFSENSFEAVICQFSLMFFPDKLTALQEVARVLKPGGIFIFNIWDSFKHNHFVQTINNGLIRLFPDDPPPFFEIPYGYHKIDEVKELLDQAGFGEIQVSILPKESICANARQLVLGYILGTPVSKDIAKREDVKLEEVLNFLENVVIEEHGSHSLKAKMQAIVFQANPKLLL